MKQEEKITGETVFLYAERDEVARGVLKKYFVRLVHGIVDGANIFQPQAIILGGGICASLAKYLGNLEEETNKQAAFPIKLLIAEHQNNAGVLGGAASWIKG